MCPYWSVKSFGCTEAFVLEFSSGAVGSRGAESARHGSSHRWESLSWDWGDGSKTYRLWADLNAFIVSSFFLYFNTDSVIYVSSTVEEGREWFRFVLCGWKAIFLASFEVHNRFEVQARQARARALARKGRCNAESCWLLLALEWAWCRWGVKRVKTMNTAWWRLIYLLVLYFVQMLLQLAPSEAKKGNKPCGRWVRTV